MCPSKAERALLNQTIPAVLYNKTMDEVFQKINEMPVIKRIGHKVEFTEVLTENGKCFVYNALPLHTAMFTEK
jgi:predicted regulator of amino acid metabolism with ACT domain